MKYFPERGRPALALVALALVAGCAPTVGPRATACDEDLARTVVYTYGGRPAYLGQALLIQSCGGMGFYCHAPGVRGENRYGVPFELDFAALPLAPSDETDESLETLARVQATVHRYRNLIWSSVLDGSMPPGAAGAAFLPEAREGYAYWVAGDDPHPDRSIEPISDDFAREALRNWLACGAPVVERTRPLSVTPLCDSDEDCEVSGVCQRPWCASIGDTVPDFDLPFDDISFGRIYQDVLGPACASSRCHGTPAEVQLDLSTEESARRSLALPFESIRASADGGRDGGSLCAGDRWIDPTTGEPRFERVVPGDPEHSLLYLKLDPNPPCGDTMPFGPSTVELSFNQVEAVRLWILCSPLAPGDRTPPPEECCDALAATADPACCTASPPSGCPDPLAR